MAVATTVFHKEHPCVERPWVEAWLEKVLQMGRNLGEVAHSEMNLKMVVVVVL